MSHPGHFRAAVAGPGLIAAFALFGCQPATSEAQTQVVQGVQFAYGVVKSETVLAHPAEHPERTMHEGVPAGPDTYHVVLALRDAKAGTRIQDADVTLALSGPGHPGRVVMALAPMGPADALTYGGYVSLPSAAKYRLTFAVTRPGAERRAVQARFLFQRPA
jgi:hypothetical protein